MPRKTIHQFCIRCSNPAQVCAYTGFYVLTSKTQDAKENRTGQQQVRAVLPARGFCFACFIKYAKSQGWDQAVLRKVRSKLGIKKK